MEMLSHPTARKLSRAILKKVADGKLSEAAAAEILLNAGLAYKMATSS